MGKLSALLIALLFVAAFETRATAQQRPDVDTLTIGGIRTSLPSGLVHSLAKFDTIFWNPDSHVGMLRKSEKAFGYSGQYLVSVEIGFIQQVSFAIGVRSKLELDTVFNILSDMLRSKYGPPDNGSSDEIRWEGTRQFFALRKSPEENGVNLVLSQFERK